ncbi:hypothetical protein [Pseudonocardia sp. NPDC049154]|uniref:hypothetical protein n=1 Tax=Pseudonocardia sp. NPDC049154 TaxID=3155501 RepID=UPI0034069153
MTQGTIKRDRWDRPLILPAGGGKEVPYTRVTTLAGAIEDGFGIGQWKMRNVAKGLAKRPDLLLSVSAHEDDTRELNKICEQAQEASGASAASTKGTAVHIFTEKLDGGEKLPPAIPPEVMRKLDLYQQYTAGMSCVAIEEFLVCDELQAAGTADRIYEFGGNRYIGDLKTGKGIDLGIAKIAAQLAIYSRSVEYDEETGERRTIGVNQDWGIVVHLPAGRDGEEDRDLISLYWIDLNLGWRIAKHCYETREIRKLKMPDVVRLISTNEESAA